MTIKVAGSLIPGTTNTPLDERSRVATLAELETLQNPYLGQLVYCLATGKYYIITALKSRVIGAREVKDAAVASWQELATGGSDSGSDSGVVPVIGDNGNWWINGKDTGKKATGTGSNVVLSASPPAEPYDGMIWCTVENALDYTYLNVTETPVVISTVEPVEPENGTIWIMEE